MFMSLQTVKFLSKRLGVRLIKSHVFWTLNIQQISINTGANGSTYDTNNHFQTKGVSVKEMTHSLCLTSTPTYTLHISTTSYGINTDFFKFQLYWLRKVRWYILSSFFPQIHALGNRWHPEPHHNRISITIYYLLTWAYEFALVNIGNMYVLHIP